MTDHEVSRLVSDLSKTAQVLNEESNSINDIITGLEAKLGEMNIGLEVWAETPLAVTTRFQDDNNGEPVEDGCYQEELGYGSCHLMTRQAEYRNDGYGGLDLVVAKNEMRLLDASRATRIAAMSVIPELLKALKVHAGAAVQAIRDAKRFVN